MNIVIQKRLGSMKNEYVPSYDEESVFDDLMLLNKSTLFM